MIELLAAHAAIAITNAGLYERSRELSMLAERNRLALELHDAVSQKLFSLVLDRGGGRHAARPRPGGGARAGRPGCGRSPREALEELRSLILELRPPELERDGLCGALRKHVEMLRRLHRVDIDLDVDDDAGSGGPRDREVLRVAQEALAERAPPRGAGAARRAPRAGATGAWRSRSPTTARASIPAIRSCARGGSG